MSQMLKTLGGILRSDTPFEGNSIWAMIPEESKSPNPEEHGGYCLHHFVRLSALPSGLQTDIRAVLGMSPEAESDAMTILGVEEMRRSDGGSEQREIDDD